MTSAATDALTRKRHASPEALARGRARRTQIVEAATALFSNAGYRGTGLAGIAAEVGVTQAGLLHHFPSKEKLLEEVVRRRSEVDAPLIDEIIGHGGLEIFDRVHLLAEHNAARPGLSQLFTVLVAENLLPEHPINDFFVGRYRALRRLIADRLREAQRRGEIAPDADVESVSRRLVAGLDGLQTQWLLDPSEVDLVTSYRELGAAFRKELTPRR
jgi:AcrR family transcriptional regulator